MQMTTKKRTDEAGKTAAEHRLRERVKELNCLYKLSEIFRVHTDDFEKGLEKVPDLIQSSWQYPDVCCVRLMLDKKKYRTRNFRKTGYLQSAEIKYRQRQAKRESKIT